MNPYANGRKTSSNQNSNQSNNQQYERFPEPDPYYGASYQDFRNEMASNQSQPSQPPPVPSLTPPTPVTTSGHIPMPVPTPPPIETDTLRVPHTRPRYEQMPVPSLPEPRHSSDSSFLQVPWDANSVPPLHHMSSREKLVNQYDETSLIHRSPSESPSLSANTSKESFVPESYDLESQQRRPLNRSQSIRNALWGQFDQGDEYADDLRVDHQVPINGDEYQLNTWNEEPSEHEQQQEQALAGEYDYGTGFEPNFPIDSPTLETRNVFDDQNGVPEGTHGSVHGSDANGSDTEGNDNNADDASKGIRTVDLFRGNLVLDCPVSTKLLNQYPEHNPVREFTHMRYTAATCDPADFYDDQYTLRQMCYSQPRQTELCICVTVYNEDDILLARTLQGVFNNIRHLCNRNRSNTWGPEAWKKVVVCVVADGRDKLNPRAKALMAALGVYQEGFAKNLVNDKEVEAHIYEYTSMVRISHVNEKKGVKLTTDKATPVQLLFCMKEKNKKKINSHRWFFQAFGKVLNPHVCVLLDSGTRPGNHSIYHLWKSFDKDPQVAGACGEIAAMLGTGGKKLINPLVAAQNFEYKMSNILDKPSESIFGFITVLPGAFSAYRFEALQNHPNGTGPLEKYFKGEKLEGKGGVFQANMYLAEDRILCWELVSKKNADWVLRYVKSAKAHTDVPERLSELILQRRRWLNGSFFAGVYALFHCFSIWTSGHSILRKLSFHIQFLYQAITLIFSWFSLANFFLVFNILATALGDPSVDFVPGKILGIVLSWVYAACIITVFIMSFGNRPQGTKWLYNLIVTFFCLMMGYMVFATVFLSVKAVQYAICANSSNFQPILLWTNSTFRDLIITVMATYALYLVSSLLFLDPWHVFTSLPQYIILSPTYINVMNVYAFCNTHDISWGTKGDTQQRLDLGAVKANETGKLELELPTSTDLVDKYYLDEVNTLSTAPPKEEPTPPSDADLKRDFYALFRSVNVIVWVLMNLALVGVVLNIGGFQSLMGVDENKSNFLASSTKRMVLRATEAAASTCKEVSTGGNIVSKTYMAVIFWAVAGMAAYRFILCMIYLILWVVGAN